MARQRNPMAELARKAVEKYVRYGKVFKPRKLTAEMKSKAGVFVSIKKHGELRGCIGTFMPTMDSVAEEVVANAIGSATQDPRFVPVGVAELNDLEYSVDVLTRPEPVQSVDQLDPKKYGIIVESGFRRGLLLPDLERVDTVEEQIIICRAKAGISTGEPIKLYRFQVKRFN
jgi:AmmeMemoRadiSam system protein A